MNILLSAYACRPEMGSEPAVGWNWVVELSKYHNLWVLTNFTNEQGIEEYKQKNPESLKNVQFIYVRVNPILSFWYKEWKKLERLYYYLWQRKALRVACSLKFTVKFDFVQHITYVTCLLPTFMYKLDIPFIYGPISGGESIPKVIGYPMNTENSFFEYIRYLAQGLTRISLTTDNAFKKAEIIVAVTEETKQMIPEKYRSKVEIVQAIGLDSEYFKPEPQFLSHKECHILIAGRMLYWKGFEMGISAAVKALEAGSNIDLTVLGDGSQEFIQKLKWISGRHLYKRIHFVKKVEYGKMKAYYNNFDVLLNCSLRDSGCMVVMEAMSRGLPVICVDTGGPGVNTTEACAIKVQAAPYEQMIDEISKAIIMLANNSDLRISMGKASYKHALASFRYDSKIMEFQKYYKLEKS